MVGSHEAKDWALAHLKGIFTSPSAPLTEDFKLDENGLISNAQRAIDCGARGVGFGFLDAWGFTIAQRKHAMKLIAETVRGQGLCTFYTTDHSIAETLALSTYAKEIGADAIFLYVPYEWASSQDMMYDYVAYVAKAVNIPIIVFNTPHSGLTLTHETMARIAKIPNVCGFKNAIKNPQHTITAFDMFSRDLVVSYPFEDRLLEMTTQHGQQALLGSTSVYLLQSPERQPIRDYLSFAEAGDIPMAEKIHQELTPLREVWGSIYSVLWNEKKASHPLGLIKLWMDILGMAGGPLGPPMPQVDAEVKQAFRERFDAAGWERLLFPSHFEANKFEFGINHVVK
ncbi:dihydrodipicolinate synthase family protein [Paracoccaceae bacterium]|nr:dihydrodipicolinate synthase family protein [Paracoccaceae bacterium]